MFEYCTAELFSQDNSYYAFDGEKFIIWKNDQAMYETLLYIKENHSIPSGTSRQIMTQIMQKVNAGLFFLKEKPAYPIRTLEAKTLVVSFPIVHGCNLRCRYCYAKSGDVYSGKHRVLSMEILDGIIEFIKTNYNDISIIRLEFVSGGETLLNPDLFFTLVNHFKEKLTECGYQVHIMLLTNGTKLTEEILSRIVALDCALALSLDGPKEVQDYQRPFQNGEGTYERVLESIHMLQKLSNFHNNYWVVSVISAKTPDLWEVLCHNKELGITSMEMRVMRGNEPKELALNQENLAAFISLYEKFAEKLIEKPNDVLMILNEYDTFGKLLKRILLKKGAPRRCPAGDKKFSFTADGDIYPCDSFVGREAFVLGNVIDHSWNDSLAKEFQSLNFVSGREIKPCSNCSIRYMCGSDCHYNSYVCTGTIWNKESVFCQLQKKLFHIAVDLLETIKEKHPKEYQYIYRVAKMQDQINEET
ncbi:MAG TPA: radical SAM protein [Mobilitalea sp.]|nr:radical SAM protein [Mobilitalea sp.]